MEPKTPKELYWAKMAGEDVTLPEPKTPEEAYLAKMAGDDVTLPDPKTPKEYYMKSVAENGGCGGTSDAPPLYSALVTATYVFNDPSLVDAELFGIPYLGEEIYAVYKDGYEWKLGMDYDSETYVAEYNAVGQFFPVQSFPPTGKYVYVWKVRHGVEATSGSSVDAVVPSNIVNMILSDSELGTFYIIDPTKPASITWTVTINGGGSGAEEGGPGPGR